MKPLKVKVKPPPYDYQPVPRLFPGETVVVLATGPSLTQDDVTYVRGRARVVAIKQAITLAPWADVHYGCDAKYWMHASTPRTSAPLRYALELAAAPYAQVLKHGGVVGLSTDPSALMTGQNSGVQAIGVAVHLGAARIVLLGFDQQKSKDGRDHFFGAHPWNDAPNYIYPDRFAELVRPLHALGVVIVNCTRHGGALTCFKRASLREVLA